MRESSKLIGVKVMIIALTATVEVKIAIARLEETNEGRFIVVAP